jgi:hypothetical protein
VVLWRKCHNKLRAVLFCWDAPSRNTIKTRLFTLTQLHAELAGKLLYMKRATVKIRTAMMQMEAFLQMLKPGFGKAPQETRKQAIDLQAHPCGAREAQRRGGGW